MAQRGEHRRAGAGAERLLARLVGRAVDDQHAVEVVELVLRDPSADARSSSSDTRCPPGRGPRGDTLVGRSTGTCTPCIDRQPSSSALSRRRGRRSPGSRRPPARCRRPAGRRRRGASRRPGWRRGRRRSHRPSASSSARRAAPGRRRTAPPRGPASAAPDRGTGGSARAPPAQRFPLRVELLVFGPVRLRPRSYVIKGPAGRRRRQR